MTESGALPTVRFPRVALGVAWFLAAAVVAALGWLSFAMSEQSGGRLVGAVLLAVALLGGVTAGILLGGRSARRLSLASSAAFALAGVVAAISDLSDGRSFTADLLLLAGVPVAFALLTALLALRR
jgi:hypothetical protein